MLGLFQMLVLLGCFPQPWSSRVAVCPWRLEFGGIWRLLGSLIPSYGLVLVCVVGFSVRLSWIIASI